MAICQEVISKVIQKKIEKSALMRSKLIICKQSPCGLQAVTLGIPAAARCRYGAPPCTDRYGEVRRSIGAAHNKLFTPYSSVAGVHHRARRKWVVCIQSPDGLQADHTRYTRCGTLSARVRRLYGEVRRSIGAAHNKLFTPYSSVAGVHHRPRRKQVVCIQSPDGLLTAKCTRKFQPLFKSPVTAFQVSTTQLALPSKISPSDISKKKQNQYFFLASTIDIW